MKPTLTHIALHVVDLDACIDFYQRYCQMHICHEREKDGKRIVWICEAGKEKEFIIVLMPKGNLTQQADNDYTHFGFALESKEAVDQIAAMAKEEGCLTWPCIEEPYPVGYYCGVKDPNGTVIEFSYGQPLGPGSG